MTATTIDLDALRAAAAARAVREALLAAADALDEPGTGWHG